MRSAPSPYSPPTPMPALMTSENTRTPLAVWRSPLAPFTCFVNLSSAAFTLVSISRAVLAWDTAGNIKKLLTRLRQTAHTMLLLGLRARITVSIRASLLRNRSASDPASTEYPEAWPVLVPFLLLGREGRPLASLLMVLVPGVAGLGHEVHLCAEGGEGGRIRRRLSRRDTHERRREHHNAKDDDRKLLHGLSSSPRDVDLPKD